MADDAARRRRSPPTRRRPRSVRARTTLLATSILAVTLVLVGAGLLGVLTRQLEDDVERSARLRAEDVAALVDADAPFDRLAADDVDRSLVQVIDARGTVVASSSNVAGEPPVLDLAVGGHGRTDGLAINPDETFVVVSEPAAGAAGAHVVLTARSIAPAQDSVEIVRDLLLVAVPLLLAAMATVTWIATGRALAPVERMRAEAASIGAAALDRRVPEPGSGDEVARLARTLNEMLDRLEAASARQRRFVSDASHELRSPIATIRHLVEVAARDTDDADVTALAAAVLEEDLRLQGLVEDLLVLARLDEGRREPWAAVDVDDLVLVEVGRSPAGSVRVDVSAVSAGQVLGDARQLQAVVRNLVDNGRRHARATVTVSLGTTEDQVVLTVADDGAGVPPEDRAAVFERFARLDASRARDDGGQGLGLAIVREVVVDHGGSVEVGDSAAGGAAFVVRLPAHR